GPARASARTTRRMPITGNNPSTNRATSCRRPDGARLPGNGSTLARIEPARTRSAITTTGTGRDVERDVLPVTARVLSSSHSAGDTARTIVTQRRASGAAVASTVAGRLRLGAEPSGITTR